MAGFFVRTIADLCYVLVIVSSANSKFGLIG